MIVDSISVSSCRRHRCCCVRPIFIAAAAPVWNWKQTFWWDLSKKLLAGWSGSISKCMEWMAVLCTILGTYLYSTGLWMVLVLLMRFTAISCLNEWRAGLSCELLSEQTNPPPLEKQNGHEVLDNSLLLYYCIVVAESEQPGYMPSWSW